MPYPVVPEYITVHLGAPDAPAENITVTFPRYIKGVAASEIYPTWNEAPSRANVLAQISVALNRVYTEFYRSRGYDFDITNNTQYDQAFSPNKETFENINAIVDDIFNNYIVRRGNVEPAVRPVLRWRAHPMPGGCLSGAARSWRSRDARPTRYCSTTTGRTSTWCTTPRWGQHALLSRTAADRGQRGRGRPHHPAGAEPHPQELSRPPAIAETDGVFGADTAAAVRTFQRIFGLTEDGIVGKGTWYRIKSIYNGVKSLSEVTSEGLTISEAQRQFPKRSSAWATPASASRLSASTWPFLGFFLPELPPIRISDVFDEELRDAVLAFQSTYGLTVDGVVGRNTWNAIQNVYEQTLYQLPANYQTFARQIYPRPFSGGRRHRRGGDAASDPAEPAGAAGQRPALP